MNTKRGLNNILYGILSQVITMGISIIVPRLVLINLGSETNGLLHSISTVFTYLSLLEAGVGKATNQALYKPLASDDKNEINRIMRRPTSFTAVPATSMPPPCWYLRQFTACLSKHRSRRRWFSRSSFSAARPVF